MSGDGGEDTIIANKAVGGKGDYVLLPSMELIAIQLPSRTWHGADKMASLALMSSSSGDVLSPLGGTSSLRSSMSIPLLPRLQSIVSQLSQRQQGQVDHGADGGGGGSGGGGLTSRHNGGTGSSRPSRGNDGGGGDDHSSMMSAATGQLPARQYSNHGFHTMVRGAGGDSGGLRSASPTVGRLASDPARTSFWAASRSPPRRMGSSMVLKH